MNGGGVNNDGDDISNDGDSTCKSTTSSASSICLFEYQHAADEEEIPALALRKAETAAVSAVAETAHPGAQAAQTEVV